MSTKSGTEERHSSAEALRLRLQRELGPEYELGERLADGAVTMVFRLREAAGARELVVKSPRWESLHKDFSLEISALARVHDTHVVPVYVWARQNDLCYCVQPFFSRHTLSDLMHMRKQFGAGEVGRVVGEMASGLDALHQAGIAFCDVSPTDVALRDMDGRAVILGLGPVAVGQLDPNPDPECELIGANRRYYAPEMIRGLPTDRRTDQYMLAMIAFEMMSGSHPFGDHRTPSEMVVGMLKAEPRSVRALRPEIPQAVADVIARALSRAPDDRFPSITAFAGALARMTETGDTPSPLVSLRRWWKAVIPT